jgi:hypothetical protein
MYFPSPSAYKVICQIKISTHVVAERTAADYDGVNSKVRIYLVSRAGRRIKKHVCPLR